MKLALIISLINPNVDGVLLIGNRGTGKSTAVRGLINLLPNVDRSLCTYGCLPEDIETGGIDEVCPDCARKYGEGESLVYRDSVQLIELPLNAKLEDVIGGLDSRTGAHHRHRLRRGILSRADRNLLYIDEVNMLDDEIVDSILDAAGQGAYTVRRGSFAATYRSRFVLIGSMNPEEGRLRPQILDRFGLRVLVSGLKSKKQRLEAYQRTIAYRTNPRQIVRGYANATALVREELQGARDIMSKVTITKEAERYGLDLIKEMGIDSLRAEISLFEAARARAVAEGINQRHPRGSTDCNPTATIGIYGRFLQGPKTGTGKAAEASKTTRIGFEQKASHQIMIPSLVLRAVEVNRTGRQIAGQLVISLSAFSAYSSRCSRQPGRRS